ncbi:hypothetical protein GcM1_125002 [Golovinomyces cichoracearum]|uniref:Uncharacterized protein n=1 Tax=Golovinomyces cichoracearum TaxID=62708 RepID=A0A420JBU8_9PEZI|nr:hypothetical protein GcM1_125002 [Golovinomyces cichoracearum]
MAYHYTIRPIIVYIPPISHSTLSWVQILAFLPWIQGKLMLN